MDDQKEDNLVVYALKNCEAICWGCGLRLLLSSDFPIFKCGWCGAVTNHNQKSRKPDGVCFSRWRRLRDRLFIAIVFLFMLFVICAGVWAVYPIVFSVCFFCGIFHSTVTAIMVICTMSSFYLASSRSAGAPPSIIWGSYPAVQKGNLEDYTFCTYCEKPKSPRTHHCRSCRMCVLDMDHHCPFIGNCVGAGNHQYFISFLISIVVSCAYVVAMSLFAGYRIWPPLENGSLGSIVRSGSVGVTEILTRQRRDRLRRRQRCSVAKVSCSPSSALEANKGVLGSQGPSQGSAWTTTEEKSQEIESCSVSRFPAEAFVGRESDGVGHSVCDELEGGDGCCYGEEDNPLLPFARMSEELFQASPVSRLLGSVTERDSERELGPEQGQIVPFALPPPPTMSEDLRIAMEQVEDAYMGKESVTGDNGCLSKSEVKDILTKMEHFMETQACDTAMKIGVSFDGVDKGLKSSMLLIKRRWMADMARKAKADVAGKANSEES